MARPVENPREIGFMPVLRRRVMPISQKGPRGGLCDLKTAAKCVFWAENESQRGWRGGRGPKPEVRGRNAVSGPRRAENGGMTTKSMKMAQNRVRSAHLREFAFICGPFWAFGGLRRAGKPVFYRKWTQMDTNGGLKQVKHPSVRLSSRGNRGIWA